MINTSLGIFIMINIKLPPFERNMIYRIAVNMSVDYSQK